MAHNALKDEIRQYIKTNGANEITGQILQNVLLDMVDEIPTSGDYATQAWTRAYIALQDFLPRTAGSEKPLTGDLYLGSNLLRSQNLDHTTILSPSGVTVDGVAVAMIDKVVKLRDAGWSYNNVASLYRGGSGAKKYFRIAIPDNAATWTMIHMELSLMDNYILGKSGKILVYGEIRPDQDWQRLNATIVGNLSDDVAIYASDRKYIYVYNNRNYTTISIDKMLLGDNIIGQNITDMTIDSVDNLPESYQTAVMRKCLTNEGGTIKSSSNTPLTIQTGVENGTVAYIGFANAAGSPIGRLGVDNGVPKFYNSITDLSYDILTQYNWESIVKHIKYSFMVDTGLTVGQAKAQLATAMAQQHGESVGDWYYVPTSYIDQWDNDNAQYYPSSAYAMIKVGGGYDTAVYGQWLLSNVNLNKLGVVGRINSVWSTIKWLAYDDEVLHLTGGTLNTTNDTPLTIKTGNVDGVKAFINFAGYDGTSVGKLGVDNGQPQYVNGSSSYYLKSCIRGKKSLQGTNWYRILDCRKYPTSFLITFAGFYNYYPPTPVTFLVSHSYTKTTITQIGGCAYLGAIKAIRAIHHDTYQFYIDVKFEGENQNPCDYEVTPLYADNVNFEKIDYTIQTDGGEDAICNTTTGTTADYATNSDTLDGKHASDFLLTTGGMLSGLLTISVGGTSGNQDALILNDTGEGTSENARIRWTSTSFPSGIALVPNTAKTNLAIEVETSGTLHTYGLLHTNNYSTYALSKNGGGMTGNISFLEDDGIVCTDMQGHNNKMSVNGSDGFLHLDYYSALSMGVLSGTTLKEIMRVGNRALILNSYDSSGTNVGYTEIESNDAGLFIDMNGSMARYFTVYTDGEFEGDLTAYSFIQSSDERIKNIIENINIDINDIANAPMIRYQLKDAASRGTFVGSTAQHWQQILPEAIRERNGILSMEYGVIALLSAIATAKKVVSLEKRIEILEKTTNN